VCGSGIVQPPHRLSSGEVAIALWLPHSRDEIFFMGGSYSATSLSRISTAKSDGNSDCALAGNIPWLRAPGGIDFAELVC
jgi:hypothetical protein